MLQKVRHLYDCVGRYLSSIPLVWTSSPIGAHTWQLWKIKAIYFVDCAHIARHVPRVGWILRCIGKPHEYAYYTRIEFFSQVILLSTLVDTGWHSDVTVSSMLGNTVRPAKIAVFPSLLTS